MQWSYSLPSVATTSALALALTLWGLHMARTMGRLVNSATQTGNPAIIAATDRRFRRTTRRLWRGVFPAAVALLGIMACQAAANLYAVATAH